MVWLFLFVSIYWWGGIWRNERVDWGMKARRQREPGFSKELLQLSDSPYHIQKSLFHFPTKSLFILAHKWRDRRDYGRLCSPRNWILVYLSNQRCFLVSRFFYEQIEEPNGMDRTHMVHCPWNSHLRLWSWKQSPLESFGYRKRFGTLYSSLSSHWFSKSADQSSVK